MAVQMRWICLILSMKAYFPSAVRTVKRRRGGGKTDEAAPCTFEKAPPEVYSRAGKKCPDGGTCLNDNLSYFTFADAWKACGEVVGCGFIHKQKNPARYVYKLRRVSDPDIANHEGMMYTCEQDAPPPPPIDRPTANCAPPVEAYGRQGKDCPAGGTCLNGNAPYLTFADAWKACGETPGCGFIHKQQNSKMVKYHLRRASDPDGSHEGVFYTCNTAERDRCTFEHAPPEEYVRVGKTCPLSGCLNDNLRYRTLAAAWYACSNTAGCNFINKEAAGYFLRRASDPDSTDTALPINFGMVYECEARCPPPPEALAEALAVAGKDCPDHETKKCLYMNRRFATFDAAWKACALVDGCGFIHKQHNGYFLRRASDPDSVNPDAHGVAFHCEDVQPPEAPEPEEPAKMGCFATQAWKDKYPDKGNGLCGFAETEVMCNDHGPCEWKEVEEEQ